MPTLTLEQCEEALGEPALTWGGRCYEIACAIAGLGLAEGYEAVYGHYLGLIKPGTLFAERGRYGWVQHGWLVNGAGEVIDPTRWAFEGVEPYLYIGPGDDYDEGGNQVRSAFLGTCPTYEEGTVTSYGRIKKDVVLDLSPGCHEHVAFLCNFSARLDQPVTLSLRQASWLANQPPAVLGPHALEVFVKLSDAGLAANIPLDNRRRVLGR